MNAYDEGYAAHAQEEAPRIAALEAELTKWKEMANAQATDALDQVKSLEAELERLRCCGNCVHLFDDCGQGLCGWANPSPTQVGSPHVHFADPCFRAPSRWQRREG